MAYSRVVAQFLLFLWRLSNSNHPVPNVIAEKMRRFYDNRTKTELTSLLWNVVSEIPNTSKSIDTVLTLFLYSLTKLPKGDHLRPEGITSVCSKIKYMIKLALIESTRYVIDGFNFILHSDRHDVRRSHVI